MLLWWIGLSDKAIQYLKDKGLRFNNIYNIPRHNPLLVECVKELGEDVNDDYSNLCIECIDSNMYYIEDCDGLEEIHTSTEQWIIIK